MVKKFPIVCTLLISFAAGAQTAATTAAHPVPSSGIYKIKPRLDIPITVVTDAWSIYGMSKIYNRDRTPVAEILALDKNNINAFDRPVVNNYSLSAKSAADAFFYSSMPLPLLLLMDKSIRKDAGKVGLLYLEAMGVTGTLYTSSAMSVSRFRPYTYNPNVDMDTRTRGGGKNSFFAGHPALVATSTFFVAKVLSDYHPEWKNKWILYSLAGTAAATTGYLRIKAGQHFKTDVLTGLTVGTLSGILIPHFHKADASSRFTYLPNYSNGASSVTVLYRIGGQ